MPTYSYSCNNCDSASNFVLTIGEFKKLSKRNNFNLFCEKCDSNDLNRVIKPTANKIERRRDEIAAIAKEEARAITNKIKRGDQKAIRDVFGES